MFSVIKKYISNHENLKTFRTNSNRRSMTLFVEARNLFCVGNEYDSYTVLFSHLSYPKQNIMRCFT